MNDEARIERMVPAARRALEFVAAGQVVGLGSGRAALAFIRTLGAAVAGGLQVRGVPTSTASEAAARALGIPIATLDEVGAVDVSVDGADEVSPSLELIKGYGGALVREHLVHAASRRVVILAGEEKLVRRLGERGRLPVEVVPFGLRFCRERITAATGYRSDLRRAPGGEPWVSDNGNHLLYCLVPPIEQPAQLERTLRDIPGVVATGLFLGVAAVVLLQRASGQVDLRERAPTAGEAAPAHTREER